ncbi:MAG TPA: 1-acyl-sn-glycerol-3-phosphate acyltransferase [Labilithrix sp.]|nr:1-acyl-sn-glycerol-3-phosphate acyltransferase [Labilithrix sp.]
MKSKRPEMPKRNAGASAGARPANGGPPTKARAANTTAQKPPARAGASPRREDRRPPPKTATQRAGHAPAKREHQQAKGAAATTPPNAVVTPEAPAPARPLRAAVAQVEPAGRAPTVVAQIRELEAQLDRLLDEAARHQEPAPADDSDLGITREAPPDPAATVASAAPVHDQDPDGMKETQEIPCADLLPDPPPVPRASSPSVRNLDRLSGTNLGQTEGTVFDTARELLTSDFYLRKWGRLAMRGRSEEVDDFGFDPIYEQKARVVLEFLYTRYFRVATTGIERIPARGRCLLVANHSGTLPLDGVMLRTAVKLEHSSPRDVRWLTEDFIYHMPYLGSMMNRLGAVRACQENAERLLGKEQLCAVFPEGLKGIGKLFAERYRLQRFGRGGFIKLCLRTNTPIIPVAVVGAEETNPLLFKIEYLSKALGLPYVPVTPTFPALGPLGLLPAPTKWQIHFGEPLDFSSHGRDAADDDLLVGKLAERVRATIQGMLDRAVGSRKSVFFG